MLKLGIVIATVYYRETAVFGDEETGCGDFGREGGGKRFAKFGAIGIEHKPKRAAKDDAVGFDRGGERNKAEEYALGDLVPIFWVGDFAG